MGERSDRFDADNRQGRHDQPSRADDDMPTSARKSSIGGLNRRGPQKYVPYRADDLQHGKRTGIAVRYIDRDSDGFEPFEGLMGQADLRTPPKAKMPGKKRRAPKTPVIEEDDEGGEMSMELDDSEYLSCNSPLDIH
jgi:centromere protein C